MSAGCVFKSDTHVLMGYQNRKGYMSGLGGKRIGNETFQHTAFRETVEELFGYTPAPRVVNMLVERFIPRDVIYNGFYTMFVFTLDDLTSMLRFLRCSIYGSPMYTRFPLTIDELIHTRRVDSYYEVGHLCLMPIMNNVIVDNRDMKYLAISK